jgi:hypothetical protein
MGTAFRLGAALLAAVYAAIGLYMALAFLPLTWPSAFVLLVASIVPAPDAPRPRSLSKKSRSVRAV